MPDDNIATENLTSPGRTERVNRARYEAMRDALLAVLPDTAPGLRTPYANVALLRLLPEALFPGGDEAGWRLKAVEPDLEARAIDRRAPSRPVQLHRTTPSTRN